MARNEKHRDQVKAGNKARAAALKRLVQLHRGDYDRIYAEEATKLGISPAATRRRARIERLKQELSELEGDGGVG